MSVQPGHQAVMGARMASEHDELTAQYRRLVGRVREVVDGVVPPDTTVLVVSKGDDDLLQLEERRAWHFPRAADGGYAGYYPADDAAAIAHFEGLRTEGGDYLLFPATAFWWLEYYVGFSDHLERRYRRVAADESCVVFALNGIAKQH